MLDMKSVIEVFVEINKVANQRNCTVTYEEESGEDCYTANFTFRDGNSNYSDCLVFYATDDFSAEELLTDLSEIVRKAKIITD